MNNIIDIEFLSAYISNIEGKIWKCLRQKSYANEEIRN